MAERAAGEIASTISTAHINPNPDPKYDVNPSTAASTQVPARFRSEDAGTVASDEIPVSILEQPARKNNLPPLPDLRFEQSYLARINNCKDGWSVAWVTFFDHVLMPFSQGMIWHLLIFGWRAGNAGTRFNGRSVGARIRRWWWNVNNWKLPQGAEGAKAESIRDFYEYKSSNAGAD